MQYVSFEKKTTVKISIYKFYISVYLAIVRNKQTRNFWTNAAWKFRFERSPNHEIYVNTCNLVVHYVLMLLTI